MSVTPRSADGDGQRSAARTDIDVIANRVNGDVHGLVVQAFHIDKVEHHVHPRPLHDQALPQVFGTVPPRAGAFQHRQVTADLPAWTGESSTALPEAGSRILSGLGGAGKTQLAAEHARALWSNGELDVLMWVAATSRDAIVSTYARAAMVVCGGSVPDPEQAATRWLEWLAATEARWLVVLDDVQDPRVLQGLWPPHTPTGAVVVTTRRRDAALSGHGRRLVEVGLFTPAESVAFLTQRLAARPAQAAGAAELAAELGHLPVALAQAAAYIADHTTLTCESYRARWRDRTKTLNHVLPAASGMPDEHRATVATTWSLSIDLANRLAPAGLARPLLQVMSLLDPNGIPDVLFTAPALLEHLHNSTSRRVEADEVVDGLSCLYRLNLITHDPDNPRRAVRVHSLVQRATREEMHPALFDATARTAADALVEVWPQVERDADLMAVLRSNTTVLQAAASAPLLDRHLHAVLFRAGRSLGRSGQLNAAIAHYSRLRPIAEHHLGFNHPDTLAIRNHLSYWRGKTGDAVGAAAAFKQLVAECTAVLGPDHATTLMVRLGLAKWRGEAGDSTAAVIGLKQVLVDRERVLGVDHPDTLTTRHELARWLGKTGDSLNAAAAFELLVVDSERVLGADHPDTLAARHNHAKWRGQAGDATGAVAMLEQVLADRERVLGIDHPDTLTTRHKLARWLGVAGHAVSAVAVLEHVLADRERVLGVDHPDTLSVRHELARWLGEAGDAAGAVAALARLLADRERTLDAGHAHILTTRRDLAKWQDVAKSRERPI